MNDTGDMCLPSQTLHLLVSDSSCLASGVGSSPNSVMLPKWLHLWGGGRFLHTIGSASVDICGNFRAGYPFLWLHITLIQQLGFLFCSVLSAPSPPTHTGGRW